MRPRDQIALVASRLGQFWKILKTLVQLILNSTWPHVITYTNQFQKASMVNQSLNGLIFY